MISLTGGSVRCGFADRQRPVEREKKRARRGGKGVCGEVDEMKNASSTLAARGKKAGRSGQGLEREKNPRGT